MLLSSGLLKKYRPNLSLWYLNLCQLMVYNLVYDDVTPHCHYKSKLPHRFSFSFFVVDKSCGQERVPLKKCYLQQQLPPIAQGLSHHHYLLPLQSELWEMQRTINTIRNGLIISNMTTLRGNILDGVRNVFIDL